MPRELSPEGMTNYFTFGHSMAPHTIFKNIYKLPPGCFLVCVPQGEEKLQIKITRYWAPPEPGLNEDAGEKYYSEEVYRLLQDSVRKQRISDVPLGVFLSGGLDSSIITGLMSSIDPSQVKTFSIGFSTGGKAYNELDDARIIARHFGTDHHELLLSENDLTQVLPTLIYHYDEPFGDAANFPTYLLSKFAREYVTVCLSGEGGDEVFGGYRRYVIENFFYRYPMMVALLSNKMLRPSLIKLSSSDRWRRIMEASIIRDKVERYTSWLSVFNKETRADLFGRHFKQSPDFDPLEIYRRLYAENGTSNVARLLYIDQQTWLPDTYLEKADKASMAVSLEVRVPFLDHALVEFAATIPTKYKISGFSTKGILKKPFTSLLPAETLRKRKHGFTPPFEPWFRDKLKGFVKEVLFDQRARSRGLFDDEYIESIYNWHVAGKGAYHWHLWLLTVFELWCQQYLDRQP